MNSPSRSSLGRIWRHEVLADGDWHTLHLTGDIVAVACRNAHIVEVWAWHHPDLPEKERTFSVFGTDQDIDLGNPNAWLHYAGPAISGDGRHEWHLIEREHTATRPLEIPE